ncbi:MAG: BlaI/MecI/CopY family transcriptional regulator [Planctomycetes bacterium]|nr:BlaI/MecI/CopY family transcriptional regulator [Planctomycetota bacterium]
MSDPKTTLGDLQLAIMRVLWQHREASAAEVHRLLLDERGLALTTIATMLRKMEEKGIVAHRAIGRVFVYRPTIDSEDVHRSMVGELVERLFQGDPRELALHLLREGDIDFDEIEDLRRQIAEQRASNRASREDSHDSTRSERRGGRS